MKASSWRRMRQAFFIASSFLSWSAVAQVPAFVPYSGRLTDGTGWGQSTQLDIRVRLYDAQTGGNIIFEGLHPATPVVDGYFTVNIGMCDAQGYCDPNPANAKFPTILPSQLWLTVQVGNGPEMQQRQPVGSVPYAQYSASCKNCNYSEYSQLSKKTYQLMPPSDYPGVVNACASADPNAQPLFMHVPVFDEAKTGHEICGISGYKCVVIRYFFYRPFGIGFYDTWDRDCNYPISGPFWPYYGNDIEKPEIISWLWHWWGWIVCCKG